MFSNPEFSKIPALRRVGTRLTACVAAVLLAGCASAPCAQPADETPPLKAAVASAAPANPPLPPQPLVPTASAPILDAEAVAQLLKAHQLELRRLEELLEKQTQQTRDVQRKLDQTHERLNALKAIERSLTPRAPVTKSTAPTPRGALVPAP